MVSPRKKAETAKMTMLSKKENKSTRKKKEMRQESFEN